MEFGITFKADFPRERMTALTRQAEAAGFTYGWVFDSHVLWQESYPLLTLMALNTERTIATAFAIGTHLSFIIWITVSGLAAMWLLRLKPSEVFYVKERSGEGTFRGPDSEAAPQPEPP